VHILLIEDDLDLGRALQAALKVDGLSSEWLRPHTMGGLDPTTARFAGATFAA